MTFGQIEIGAPNNFFFTVVTMFAALSIGRFLIIKGPPNLKIASFRFGTSLGSLLPLCPLGGGGGGAAAA